MNPQKPKHLQLTPKDLEKVRRNKARAKGKTITPEWSFVARFGKYFGWAGIKAIMNNEIDFETANTLLNGAEKEHASDIVDIGNAVYVANIASRSGKKGPKTLQDGLATYIKASKVGV